MKLFFKIILTAGTLLGSVVLVRKFLLNKGGEWQ